MKIRETNKYGDVTEKEVMLYDGSNLEELNEFLDEPCQTVDGVTKLPGLFSFELEAYSLLSRDAESYGKIGNLGKNVEIMDPSVDYLQAFTRMRIGNMVAMKRDQLGITIRELAAKAGIDKNIILRIESGEKNYNLDSLAAVAGVLGLNVGIGTPITSTECRFFESMEDAEACIFRDYWNYLVSDVRYADIKNFDNIRLPKSIEDVREVISGSVQTRNIINERNEVVAVIGWLDKVSDYHDVLSGGERIGTYSSFPEARAAYLKIVEAGHEASIILNHSSGFSIDMA